MTAEMILDAIGMVEDEAVLEARRGRRAGIGRTARWGALAACAGAILVITTLTLSGLLAGKGEPALPGNLTGEGEPAFPGNLIGEGEPAFPGNLAGKGEPALPGHSGGQGDMISPPVSEGPGSLVDEENKRPATGEDEALSSPEEQGIRIDWDKVAVNESTGQGMDAARLYYDPELYITENWGEEEVKAYYGWDLTPGYIPAGLTDGGSGAGGFLCKERATGKILEDNGGRSFWVDFWEDGSPKSDDEIVIPRGFSIRVSKTGILHCGLLPVDEERTTDFGGVSVILSHCSMKHGPFDPTQKAPDGLSNMPAGYYDIYVASFVLDGVEYEIEAHRLELEEVIRITASVINVPYNKEFTVGNP